jgi:hypothetical protein
MKIPLLITGTSGTGTGVKVIQQWDMPDMQDLTKAVKLRRSSDLEDNSNFKGI